MLLKIAIIRQYIKPINLNNIRSFDKKIKDENLATVRLNPELSHDGSK